MQLILKISTVNPTPTHLVFFFSFRKVTGNCIWEHFECKHSKVNVIFKLYNNVMNRIFFIQLGRLRFSLTGGNICGTIILTISYSNQNYEEN